MHAGRQPKEQHPGVKPSAACCFWGWGAHPYHPAVGLLRGCACPTNVKWDSELEGSLWPPNNPPPSLSFYLQVVLTHHSHPRPRTHLFSLGTSAWRPS